MAKAPVPGRVKTRLCPPLSPEAAAAVAAAALADTLQAVATCNADVKVVALDGRPGPWLPEGLRVVPQVDGAFAERLVGAWAATNGDTAGWGIQIGMDTPQVTASELDTLLETLSHLGPEGALLGPAPDGGWGVIGLTGTDPRRVFPGVAMSSPHTGAQQLARLRSLCLSTRLVPAQRDIDTVADLAAVAARHPATRTAAAWRHWLRSPGALASRPLAS
ncbi:MAG: DUF2064 domain-containing protein [Acidimicrobiia bacterium]|nr:DUF2064 domain-containing protein [Acidimicrobiia bacterium]